MKHVLVAVYDLKALEYSAPFMQRSLAEATRSFTAEVNADKPGNMLFSNPEDFQLHHVADWYPATGDIEPTGVLIVSASSLK